MCGIAGQFDLEVARAFDDRLTVAMMNAIAHRGPDGSGVLSRPGVHLGNRRLSVIDIASGQQPMVSESGRLAITFNGEIYNFLELREDLEKRGRRFRTRSDTEVLLEAWAEWGPDCLTRLNGMFAFALVDFEARTLFLVRDPLGEKPLYYALRNDRTLVFASELKSILASGGISREIDHHAIEDYLALGYVPDPKTILRMVRKLPPAHAVAFHRGEANGRIWRYWTPLAPVGPAITSLRDAVEAFSERFVRSVRLRAISDVPLGAFLSGGVDSSAVAAQLASSVGGPSRTFSIGFDVREYDESAYAREVAGIIGSQHVSEVVSVAGLSELSVLTSVYDEPFADSSALPTLALCKLARRYVTVALSGDGGDEVFGGYRRYRHHLWHERVRQTLPRALREGPLSWLGMHYPPLAWAPRWMRARSVLTELSLDPLGDYLHSVSISSEALRRRVYATDFCRVLAGYSARHALETYASEAPREPLAWAQYLDLMTYLPGDILVKVDRASMAHSLEVRVPLLDPDLVRWSFSLERALKIRRGVGKRVLKEYLRPRLPERVINRPKQGFAVPLAAWFRGPLRDVVTEELPAMLSATAPFIDVAAVRQVALEHTRGSADHAAPLFSLLMLAGSLDRLRLV